MLLVTACLAGCSLSLSAPDPKRPRHRTPECDSGKGLVAADATLGSLFAIGGLVAIGEEAGGFAAVPIGVAAAFFLAAGRGNSTANECRKAIAEFNEYVAERAGIDDDRQPPARKIPSVTPAVATQPEPAAPAPAPPPAPAPAPAPAKAAPAKPAPQPPPPPPPPADDPWSEFWKEVP